MPFPQYQSLYDLAGPVGDSSYHALQMKAEKRFAAGGMLLAAYTFSKIISNTDSYTQWLEGGATGTGLAGVQDYSNLQGERSLSSFDSRQRLTVSYVLDLPFGKGKKFMPDVKGVTDKLVSGWGINSLSTFQEGLPLGFTASPNLTGFNTGLRPNVIAGCQKAIGGPVQQRLNQFFNTECFSVPGQFTFGSESRTDPTLRGTGIKQLRFRCFQENDDYRALRPRVPAGDIQPIQPREVFQSELGGHHSRELNVWGDHDPGKHSKAAPGCASAQVLRRWQAFRTAKGLLAPTRRLRF